MSIDEIENWNSDLFDETDVVESDSEADNNVDQNAANMLIKWSEQNAALTAKHMSLLQIRSDIVKKQILKPPKQTKFTSFLRNQMNNIKFSYLSRYLYELT